MEIIDFFSKYGFIATVIAIIGIALLGCMKYFGMFKKIDEKSRHYLYIGISVAITLVFTAIYLACKGEFDIINFKNLAISTFTLNQAFYNIFSVTPINELAKKIMDYISEIKLK